MRQLLFLLLAIMLFTPLRSVSQTHSLYTAALLTRDTSIVYWTQALKIALSSRDSLQIARVYQKRGAFYRKIQKSTEAVEDELFSFGISVRNNFQLIRKSSVATLIESYLYSGRYDNALIYSLRELEICEKEKNSGGIQDGLFKIGLIYYDIESFDRSIEYFARARDFGDAPLHQMRGAIYLALCYAHKHNFYSAQNYLDESLQLFKDNGSERIWMEHEYAQGFVLLESGNAREAEYHFFRSYELSKAIHDRQYEFDNLVYLAYVALMLKDLDVTTNYLKRAGQFLGNGYHEVELRWYKTNAALNGMLGNVDMKYANLRKLSVLKDSIYGLILQQRLLTVQAEYEQEENEEELKTQDNLMQLQNKIIHNQKLVMLWVIVVVVFLSVLTLQLYRYNKDKKNLNDSIKRNIEARSSELSADLATLTRCNENYQNLLAKAKAELRSHLSALQGLAGLLSANADITDKNFKRLEQITQINDNLSDKINNI